MPPEWGNIPVDPDNMVEFLKKTQAQEPFPTDTKMPESEPANSESPDNK